MPVQAALQAAVGRLAHAPLAGTVDWQPPASILLPTDGSSRSKAAAAWCEWLAPPGPVRVLHATAEGEHADARALDKLIADMQRAGQGPARLEVPGHAASEILRVGADGADLVVMASHEEHKLEFPGAPSRLRTVIAATRTDHLVVRSAPPPSAVVVAVDGSGLSVQAALAGFWIAQRAECALHVVTVSDATEAGAAGAPLTLEGTQVHLQRLRGSPGPAIVAFAKKSHADVIVMGSRGLGGVAGWDLGSVSDYVANKAASSVWLVRKQTATTTAAKPPKRRWWRWFRSS